MPETTDHVMATVIGILEEMTSDWEIGFSEGIGPDTRLIRDLDFESIDVVQLLEEVQAHFLRDDLPFQRLIMTSDGEYVRDLAVSQLVEFLVQQLASAGSATPATNGATGGPRV